MNKYMSDQHLWTGTATRGRMTFPEIQPLQCHYAHHRSHTWTGLGSNPCEENSQSMCRSADGLQAPQTFTVPVGC